MLSLLVASVFKRKEHVLTGRLDRPPISTQLSFDPLSNSFPSAVLSHCHCSAPGTGCCWFSEECCTWALFATPMRLLSPVSKRRKMFVFIGILMDCLPPVHCWAFVKTHLARQCWEWHAPCSWIEHPKTLPGRMCGAQSNDSTGWIVCSWWDGVFLWTHTCRHWDSKCIKLVSPMSSPCSAFFVNCVTDKQI